MLNPTENLSAPPSETLRQKFRRRLFPLRLTHDEGAIWTPTGDVIVATTDVTLSFTDRLRVAIFGKLSIQTHTACQNKTGELDTYRVRVSVGEHYSKL